MDPLVLDVWDEGVEQGADIPNGRTTEQRGIHGK